MTSQKREESLQEAPLHIQAYGQNQLDDAQVTRIEEIIQLSPTVSYSTRRSYDATSVRIRGVGTSELGSGVEPSVATVVDGVVMARGGSTFNEFPDIERVEILNGPQGTLFGKNASVGLINIITKDPNRDEVESSLSVRSTSDKDYGGKYAYSAPINDAMAFRVSGFWRNYAGNIDNIVTDNLVNGVDASGWRGKLSWELSDTLDAMFSVDYSRQTTTCCPRFHREVRVDSAAAGGRVYLSSDDDPDAAAGRVYEASDPDNGHNVDSRFIDFDATESLAGGALYGNHPDVLGPQIVVGSENDKITQNFDPFQGSINRGFSVEFNKTLPGDLTLTSLTAYREWEATSGWDNDHTAFTFQVRQQHDRDVEWFSQELRLTSPESDTFDYILGLYYYTAVTEAVEISDRTTLDIGQRQLFIIDAESGYDNIAAFGHFNYHVTEQTNLFAGFRLLNDEAHAKARWRNCEGYNAQPNPRYNPNEPEVYAEGSGWDVAEDGTVGNGKLLRGDFFDACAASNERDENDDPLPLGKAFVKGKNDDTEFLYKAGVQYFFSDNINVFASYSTGYKGRGFSLEYGLRTDRILSGEEPIEGEYSDSIEVGIKGTLRDRVQFGIVFYDTVIEGLQQSVRDLSNASIANNLGSVEEVTTRGYEASFIFYLTEALTVSATYAYNDAFYSDFANDSCYLGQTLEQGCGVDVPNAQDRTGQALESAAENRFNFSGRYESQRTGSVRPFVQVNYRWSDDANISSNGDHGAIQEAFGILDLSAGLISPDDKYTVRVFAKNLLDEFYIQGADSNAADNGGVIMHYLPRDYERYFGISLGYQM